LLTVDFDRLGLRPGSLVLDIGCGQGRHTFEALKRGADVVPADLSHQLLPHVMEMAAAMSEAGETRSGAMAAASRADVLRLPFPDATFDHVIASEILEHVPADEAGMTEIYRVLKPGGRAVVTVPRFWTERVCWALSEEYTQSAGGHVRIYKNAELVGKLRAAGFEVEGTHHAHAFHSPYWWVKCAVGVDRDDAPAARAYKRFLEWQIVNRPRTLDAVERLLDPILGKSICVYASKPTSVGAGAQRVA
jgi:SAM-dependent methyltransferase